MIIRATCNKGTDEWVENKGTVRSVMRITDLKAHSDFWPHAHAPNFCEPVSDASRNGLCFLRQETVSRRRRRAVLRRGKPRTSAQPETQDLRNRRAKPLNRRAVWQSLQETRWERGGPADSNQQPDRYERPALTIQKPILMTGRNSVLRPTIDAEGRHAEPALTGWRSWQAQREQPAAESAFLSCDRIGLLRSAK